MSTSQEEDERRLIARGRLKAPINVPRSIEWCVWTAVIVVGIFIGSVFLTAMKAMWNYILPG